MPPTTAHLITHTHWDREWFLTSAYTSRWLPGLIDKVAALVAANPAFQFFLDGQTLVVADLLSVEPAYLDRVRRLVAGGHLIVGPYYCQPDWQLCGGELLLRNLRYGLEDATQLGGAPGPGWLVDTFGHIRQAPQIHGLFGIEAVYVWRGVPALEPYFTWQAPDGSQVLALYLIGGYRNLYGVTHAPEVALRRLETEVEKLQKLYPTPDLPLFDGYDLEDDPEDPLRFYAGLDQHSAGVVLQASTPEAFARAIGERQLPLPVLRSELNSGKYGAIFPGTLSTRTYLKVMAYDCEHLLLRLCEPLAALARLRGRPYPAEQLEAWGRTLLQNAVHDALCGVSIDQVHAKMERRYRQVFEAAWAEARASLAAILAGFAPGEYAVSTNPFPIDRWQVVGEALVHVQTEGVGVWPVRERAPLTPLDQPIETFAWSNDHYAATVSAAGLVRVGEATAGELLVYREKGDAYSDERGDCLGRLEAGSTLHLCAQSPHGCVLGFSGEWRGGDNGVRADVRLHFDASPMITWEMALETRGADVRVEMAFATGLAGSRHAGMPFDLVPRPVRDDDLLPARLPDDLARVLLGQRELGAVETFPFHDVVVLAEAEASAAIFARGLHAYSVDEQGTLKLVLSRAVEWLTRSDLAGRVGDAGPFFYVPGARGERLVQHVVGAAFGRFSPDGVALQALNAGFHNPPLVVRAEGRGAETAWPVLREAAPLSSLAVQSGQVLARFYNPTPQALPLAGRYRRTDMWGADQGPLVALDPGEIATAAPPLPLPDTGAAAAAVECLTPPRWRVGDDTGRPDPGVLAELERKVAAMAAQSAEVETALAGAEGSRRLRLLHRYYVLKREGVEAEFSLLLNRLPPPGPDELDPVDPEVAALGLALNQLRIKRRIFDYIVQALPDD